MRIAFVVQRYGLEVNGGAELHCRQVVERMPSEYDVEVLTTCAQDYVTWENIYPAGVDNVNGVVVRRFPVTHPRELNFGKHSAQIYNKPHTIQDEMEWIYAQGPLAPSLLEYIVQNHSHYDVFVFFTYIYFPTTLGLRLVTDRALLIPTAHDEQPLYLNIFKSLFHAPRAILFNTIEEKQLLEELFQLEYMPGEVVGLGVEVPEYNYPDRFREKYDISASYVLYVGRISISKRSDILIDDFIRYKKEYHAPLKLVMIGKVEITIPDHPDVVSLGFVSDEDKFDAMVGADVFILPSKFESLSMVFLESLAVGTPVLTYGHSEVLRGHCLRSNAGLYYSNYSEFSMSLNLLLNSLQLRQKMGENGKSYVQKNYTWDTVIEKYKYYLEMIAGSHWW